MEIKVEIEPHWAGDYRLEYDGKYITLFGKDKNYVDWWSKRANPNSPDEYDEMVLVAVVEEIRNASPEIVKVDDKYIYIETVWKRKE